MTRMTFRTVQIAAAALCIAQGISAQQSAPRTTQSGVYTAAQANAGKDTYAGMCQGCHTSASHSGPAFIGPWEKKTVWDLFFYISTEMPKTDPGTLSTQEYVQVVAYLLRLNGMPEGDTELPGEEGALKAIRIDVRVQK